MSLFMSAKSISGLELNLTELYKLLHSSDINILRKRYSYIVGIWLNLLYEADFSNLQIVLNCEKIIYILLSFIKFNFQVSYKDNYTAILRYN